MSKDRSFDTWEGAAKSYFRALKDAKHDLRLYKRDLEICKAECDTLTAQVRAMREEAGLLSKYAAYLCRKLDEAGIYHSDNFEKWSRQYRDMSNDVADLTALGGGE